MSRRGLPSGLQMRHDSHYVEELSKPQPKPVGRMLQIDLIDPNPEQPRVEIGDLSELTESIIEKGVLEPLLVKPLLTGRWMIIAGERRWRAATIAGLKEVPCVELEVNEQGIAEIALIENLQRKDLTIWEEAEGLASLCMRFGYTHDEVAKKVGKSRSSITESLSIALLPLDVKEECRRANLQTKSLLLQIARQPDDASMLDMAKKVVEKNLNRDEARLVSKRRNFNDYDESKAHKPVTFRYKANDGRFSLQITFSDSEMTNEVIVNSLKLVISELEDKSV